MPSDLERAIRWSKRFESVLERRFGARGRGLHEKIDSVENDLDREVVRALRLIATVRNKIVHEDGYDRIDDRARFKRACALADRALGGKSRLKAAVVVVGLVLILLAAAALVLGGRSPFKIL
tara:strand:- start:1224 stop:1589 length:366 start_codon:yes stop_codon:yes gene_type:complete